MEQQDPSLAAIDVSQPAEEIRFWSHYRLYLAGLLRYIRDVDGAEHVFASQAETYRRNGRHHRRDAQQYVSRELRDVTISRRFRFIPRNRWGVGFDREFRSRSCSTVYAWRKLGSFFRVVLRDFCFRRLPGE